MFLVDVKIKILVNQVAKDLINKKIQCHYFKKYWHFSYECQKNKYDRGEQGQNKTSNTSTLIKIMFLACASPIECISFQEIPWDIWYLGSGWSNHMKW